MQVLRAKDRVWTPWKNGGGRTAEIAAFPIGAGLDGFDWRVSTAMIERGGPFSVFPGIDRTLVVLSGDGVRLSLGDGRRLEGGPSSTQLRFDGEAEAVAELIGGPVLDLNVMVRRGVCSATVARLVVDTAWRWISAAPHAILLVSQAAMLSGADDDVDLGPLDAVAIGHGEAVALQPLADPCNVCQIVLAPLRQLDPGSLR